MHPEMSLVFLTVFTTVGQGIFIFLVVLHSLLPTALQSDLIITGAVTALIFQFIGMGASFFHLGNAGRGWKAILMWRNSWLSKEIISLSAFVGLAVFYLILYLSHVSEVALNVVGYMAILASVGFFIASSMVYTSIGYIKEWSNAFTPSTFISLGLAAGAGFILLLLNLMEAEFNIVVTLNALAIVLTFFSLILKTMAYRYNSNVYTSLGVSNAIGINDKNIQLMHMGTSYSHYNTKEYSHSFTEKQNLLIKKIVIAMTFVIPLILWVLSLLLIHNRAIPTVCLTGTASVIMLIGLILERRLFFIQGNHFQNLYYGNFRKSNIDNPLLS